MRFLYNSGKYLRSICQVFGLAILLLCLSLISLIHSTAKAITAPIYLSPAISSAPAFTMAVQLRAVDSTSSNPVQTALINAVPGSDGQEVFVSVSGVNSAGNNIFLNIEPGTGPAGHQGSYAMTLSQTAYLATAIGFAPGQDTGNDGDDTMSITTTVNNQVMSTGPINFQRAFVETVQPEMIFVDDSDFIVEMPNLDTFDTNVYILAMSTNASPGSLPAGYSLPGSTYNVSPSGALTESERFMTLKLAYQEPLPNGADPHTLTVLRWVPVGTDDGLSYVVSDLGGDLFDDDNHLTYATKRFGIYALANAPTWRDSFNEFSLTGVSEQASTQWGPGDTIILGTGKTSGTVTSIPIAAAADAVTWGTLHFSATTPAGTGISLDVLDLNDALVLAGASDGADLSGLSLASYPSLKLRATLTSATDGETPRLHEWSLGWTFPEIPQLTIGKAAPVIAAMNSLVTYTLIVTNSSSVSATDLLITDTIPPGAQYADSTMGGTLVDNTARFTISSLSPNEVVSRTFRVTATTTLTNRDYRVSAAGGFSATGDPATTIIVPDSLCGATIQSTGAGDWLDPSTWDLNRLPNQNDIVLIRADHTITGPAFVALQALCNFGVLQSEPSQDFHLQATSFISNYGQISGSAGGAGAGSTCGRPGSSLELRGGPIDNWGAIRAGQGGGGDRCAGPGGSTRVLGRNTINHANGTICAGQGGAVSGTADGQGGDGGVVRLHGNYGGWGSLTNAGLVCGGDGGDGNPAATAPQSGGNGGCLYLIASNLYLSGGQHEAGQGGQGAAGGSNGRMGCVSIDPNTISLAGADTRISGGEIAIFGGEDWVLDLSGMQGGAISASGNITLAVGSGGVVDLRGNSGQILQAGGEVMIASDVISLETSLTGVAGSNAATAAGQILYDASLSGPGRAAGRLNVPLPISLTLFNNGPLSDTYTLSRSDRAGWDLGSLPPPITVAGLELHDLTLVVTPTLAPPGGEANTITITATSAAEPSLVAVVQIDVSLAATEVYLPLVVKNWSLLRLSLSPTRYHAPAW